MRLRLFKPQKKINEVIFVSLHYLILTKIESSQNQNIEKLFHPILEVRKSNTLIDKLSKVRLVNLCFSQIYKATVSARFSLLVQLAGSE